MELIEIAKGVRSIRKFSAENVHLEDAIYAIKVAREAPSGANKQPWRFIIVRDKRRKEEIREICEKIEKEFHEAAPKDLKQSFKEMGVSWKKEFLTEAPILILIFGKRTEPYWIQSVWISIGYILLALREKGLATLTYTPSKVTWANDLLNVPRDYVLQAILPVGKPVEEKGRKERLPLSEILFIEEWGQSYSDIFYQK